VTCYSGLVAEVVSAAPPVSWNHPGAAHHSGWRSWPSWLLEATWCPFAAAALRRPRQLHGIRSTSALRARATRSAPVAFKNGCHATRGVRSARLGRPQGADNADRLLGRLASSRSCLPIDNPERPCRRAKGVGL